MRPIDSSLDLKEEVKNDVLIVRMKGRLDAISSPVAERKVFEAINNGQTKLLFEFSGVMYLSSAGMRMLLSTSKKLRGLSGHLIVCSVTGNVMDVLKMSGFDHVLELVATEADALNQFYNSSGIE